MYRFSDYSMQHTAIAIPFYHSKAKYILTLVNNVLWGRESSKVTNVFFFSIWSGKVRNHLGRLSDRGLQSSRMLNTKAGKFRRAEASLLRLILFASVLRKFMSGYSLQAFIQSSFKRRLDDFPQINSQDRR